MDKEKIKSKKKVIVLASILILFLVILIIVIINRDKIDLSQLMGNSTISSEYEYYCDAGWELNGKMCIHKYRRNAIYIAPDAKKEIEDQGYEVQHSELSSVDDEFLEFHYTPCKNGFYTIENGIGICLVDQYEQATNCQEGHRYNEQTKKCERTVTHEVGFTCSNGFIYDNGKCKKEVSEDAAFYYTCQSGYKLSGTKCKKEILKNPTTKYKCSSGYKLKNNKCIKGKKKISATKELKCQSGYKLKDSKCRKTEEKNATKKYMCRSGYNLNNKKCYKTIFSDPINPGCPFSDAKFENGVCSWILTYTPYCPDGSAPEYTGKCWTKKSVELACIEGDELKDNWCIAKREGVLISSDPCTDGYEADGAYCKKSVQAHTIRKRVVKPYDPYASVIKK